MKSTKSGQSNFIEQPPRRRICTSWIVPLLLLWMLPGFGAQAAVVFTTLYSFGSVQDTNNNQVDGVNPFAGLVQGSDGSFYGTTYAGGMLGSGSYPSPCGTVFKISTNGALTTLHSFTGGNDGAYPEGGLVQGSDGFFYGTTKLSDFFSTPYGYTFSGDGTVFKISTNGALTTLYAFGSFTNASGGVALDGANPVAGLVQGSDGFFYGTTTGGGTNDSGTVFKISTNGVLTSLYSFPGTDDGTPNAGLVQGSDGYFYGTSGGRVFRISTNGALTTLYPCPGVGGLVQGSDGYLYGMTSLGGTNGKGSVLKISTNGALTTLHSFTGGNDGACPRAGLVQGSDGYFYGTTEYNDLFSTPWGNTFSGVGTVFRISSSGAYTSLYSFTGGNDGANPFAGLVQGSDGSFYGTTYAGGTNGYGTVFRLTIVPGLSIIPSGPYVILTWPTNYAGFTLQSTTNLGSSAVWTTNSSPPVVIGGENVVINTMSGAGQFYRLSQ